jgi:PadR family transcriptional regulator, regulatory protein AphA
MARKSRTPMLILGLLSTEPMSGYDIKANIDRSIRHFWNESYGQLYPALKTLHTQGLVTRSDRVDGGRTSHVYAITPSGTEALNEWLSTAPAPRFVRNELLLRIFFGHLTPPAALRAHLRREQGEALGMVAGLTAAKVELEAECAAEPELPYWLLTMDLGQRSAQARADWAAAALKTLDTLPREPS